MMISSLFGIQIPVYVSIGGAFGHDTVQMIIHAGPMVKFVLLILLLFSVISWAIIFVKLAILRKAKQETETFLELFWETRELKKVYAGCEDLGFSPVARLFRAGYLELGRILKSQASLDSEQDPEVSGLGKFPQPQQTLMESLGRSLKRSTVDQVNKLERALSFLATTGNTAPFIGLFGTVWGIMNSFRGIGLKGSANLAVVAPGISEALIATAAGLAAAIPAVVAFNYFSHRISSVRTEMDIFASDFLGIVERQSYKQHAATKKGS